MKTSKFVYGFVSLFAFLVLVSQASAQPALVTSRGIEEYAVQRTELKEIPIDQLKPLQEHIGRDNALAIMDSLVKDAKAKGTTAAMLLTAKPINAVKMPDGRYYIIDGHHRAFAIWSLDPQTATKIKVKYDLSSMSFEHASTLLYQNKLVYFSKESRQLVDAKKATAALLIQTKFAANIGLVKDSVWRSYIGGFLFRRKIDSTGLIPFAEFHMVDALLQANEGRLPELSERTVKDPKTMAEVDALLDRHLESLVRRVTVPTNCRQLFAM